MGGRGASSGRYKWRGKWHAYGDEYHSLFTSGNIKFIVLKDDRLTTVAPHETMTHGRIYVTIDTKLNVPAYITYYDNNLKKSKSIDLIVPHNGVLPHVHHGLDHKENDQPKGYANLTPNERKMVQRVNQLWIEKVRKLCQNYLAKR